MRSLLLMLLLLLLLLRERACVCRPPFAREVAVECGAFQRRRGARRARAAVSGGCCGRGLFVLLLLLLVRCCCFILFRLLLLLSLRDCAIGLFEGGSVLCACKVVDAAFCAAAGALLLCARCAFTGYPRPAAVKISNLHAPNQNIQVQSSGYMRRLRVLCVGERNEPQKSTKTPHLPSTLAPCVLA
jgi:hypothetical protein